MPTRIPITAAITAIVNSGILGEGLGLGDGEGLGLGLGLGDGLGDGDGDGMALAHLQLINMHVAI